MKKKFFLLLVIFSLSFVNAQNKFIDEWEANIGYLNFQGDYGKRGIFKTTLPNFGGMIGGKMYMNFLDPYRTGCYSCQHLKFDLGFNAGYSVLSYKGVEDYYSIKISGINGHIYFFNLNLSMEYHLNNLRFQDYFSSSFFNKLDPYVGVGAGFLAYDVRVDSSLGNYEKNPEILPDAFRGNIYPDPAIVPAFNIEVGVRYRFSDELMFSFNNKWMYFLSDKVDGVVPDPTMVENFYNDWLFTPSLGVVIFVY